MLRAEFHDIANGLTLKLEGRLVGEWAQQVKSLVAKEALPKSLLVDLTEVTYVDSIGEQVLIWLCSLHSVFAAETCYGRDLCERLHLTLGDSASFSRSETRMARS